jgi:hypothetical protein
VGFSNPWEVESRRLEVGKLGLGIKYGWVVRLLAMSLLSGW